MPRFSFPRPKAGPALATALTIGLAAWMSTGNSTLTAEGPVVSPGTVALPRAVHSEAQIHVPRFTSYGETAPLHQAAIIAQESGTMSEVLEKGEFVAAGNMVARISVDALQARMIEAKALLEVAVRDLTDARSLNAKGLAPDTRVRTAETTLASAQAAFEAVRSQQLRATAVAPFSGYLDDRFVEPGTRVSAGDKIATLVDISRLLVETTVPQSRVSDVSVGQVVDVVLSTGETVSGAVTFVARSADPATRSFPVEILVDNDSAQLRSGTSASVIFSLAPLSVHEVSPAYLSLSSDGHLQVKAVGTGGIREYPVTLVDTDGRIARVTGLPEKIDIATVGQASAAGEPATGGSK